MVGKQHQHPLPWPPIAMGQMRKTATTWSLHRLKASESTPPGFGAIRRRIHPEMNSTNHTPQKLLPAMMETLSGSTSRLCSIDGAVVPLAHSLARSSELNSRFAGPPRLPSPSNTPCRPLYSVLNDHLDANFGESCLFRPSMVYLPRTGRNLKALDTLGFSSHTLQS